MESKSAMKLEGLSASELGLVVTATLSFPVNISYSLDSIGLS